MSAPVDILRPAKGLNLTMAEHPISKRSARFSISEMSQSPNGIMDHSPDRSITTTLTILRSPSAKTAPLASSPSGRSPLSAFSVGMARGPAINKKEKEDPAMPQTPNKWFSEDQVFKELANTDGKSEDESAMEPCADEIMLPFRDRSKDVKELLARNPALLKLLTSDQPTAVKLTRLLDIDRDLMADSQWIPELKALIRTRSESLWERLRSCLGIDTEDALLGEDEPRTPAWHLEPLPEGELIECERLRAEIEKFGNKAPKSGSASTDSPSSIDAPLPGTTPPSPRRRHSSGGRVSFALTPIEETASAAFPLPTQPPQKVNMASLREQERQLSGDNTPIGGSGTEASFESELPEEELVDGSRLSRSASQNSFSSSRFRAIRILSHSEDPSPVGTPGNGSQFIFPTSPLPGTSPKLSGVDSFGDFEHALDSDEESLSHSLLHDRPSFSLGRVGPARLSA